MFYTLKMIVIACCFFTGDIFQFLAILIEFAHIFFIFTFRPFREEFYTNLKTITRLFFLVEYIFIVLGNVYFSIGGILYNYDTIISFLTARVAIFLVFMVGLMVALVFEIYFTCSNLNYQIKFVKEENQFKLQLIEKGRTNS